MRARNVCANITAMCATYVRKQKLARRTLLSAENRRSFPKSEAKLAKEKMNGLRGEGGGEKIWGFWTRTAATSTGRNLKRFPCGPFSHIAWKIFFFFFFFSRAFPNSSRKTDCKLDEIIMPEKSYFSEPAKHSLRLIPPFLNRVRRLKWK